MDGQGRALDNILTERLWRTLKYEEVYLHNCANPKEARRGIGIGGCISRSAIGRRRKPIFKQRRLVKNRRP